jgi:UDP-N-acetylmuramate--alanine ligase
MGFLQGPLGRRLFMVGIKGTGMASLAVMLAKAGFSVSGSDTGEVFSTDALLHSHDIMCIASFDASDLPVGIDAVIHSTAWKPASNQQLIEARRRGLPIFSYPGFLSYLASHSESYGIAGTHGKTTTAGCATWMLAPTGLPYFSVFGSSLAQSGAGSYHGDEIGIIEACEYQDHFLSYDLQGAVVLNVDYDHPDWFADADSCYRSFARFALRLAPSGFLIVCTDTDGGRRLAAHIQAERPDLTIITYGTVGESDFKLVDYLYRDGEGHYRLSSLDGWFTSRLAGPVLTGDIVGAALLCTCIALHREGRLSKPNMVDLPILAAFLREGERFIGCAGRSETLRLGDDIVLVKDYAHHPAEITTTLESLRIVHPDKRFVLVFSPHTVSRTVTFMADFAVALSACDLLFVLPVYASARNDGEKKLCDTTAEQLAEMAGGRYIDDEPSLFDSLLALLQPGDVCITMGAGNTLALYERLKAHYRSDER